jgi:hypothetical protein
VRELSEQVQSAVLHEYEEYHCLLPEPHLLLQSEAAMQSSLEVHTRASATQAGLPLDASQW